MMGAKDRGGEIGGNGGEGRRGRDRGGERGMVERRERGETGGEKEMGEKEREV